MQKKGNNPCGGPEKFPWLETLLPFAALFVVFYALPYLAFDEGTLLHIISDLFGDIIQPDPENRTG
jgi:hypothetical protein